MTSIDHKPVRVLFVGNKERPKSDPLRQIAQESSPGEMTIAYAPKISAAKKYLAKNSADAILLDLVSSLHEDPEAVRQAHAEIPDLPIIVWSDTSDVGQAMQAVRDGAHDFVCSETIDADELLRILRLAVLRKQMFDESHQIEAKAKAMLDCIGDAVASIDSSAKVYYLNRRAEDLTGWTLREAKGRPASDVLRILDANSREPVRNFMDSSIGKNRAVYAPIDCILVQKDGSEIPIEDSAAPICDSEGREVGAVFVLRDVSVAQALKREMTRSAEHDFLTGLPNRLLLNDRLRQAIAHAKRHKTKVAVLFMDLDGFKSVNDTLGHATGDQLLQSISSRLVSCIRGSDTVGRHGGDEFLILLQEIADKQSAAITAEKILHAVSRSFRVDRYELRVTASIGISIYPDDGLDADTLIRNADAAMYLAKQRGRKGHQFFTPSEAHPD